MVGQTAAPVVTAAVVGVVGGGTVVAEGAVVADEVAGGLALGLPPPDPQPVRNTPAASALTATSFAFSTGTRI
jgi:hypothetical protein